MSRLSTQIRGKPQTSTPPTEKHCPGKEIWICMDFGSPSRTPTDTVRILSPEGWILMDSNESKFFCTTTVFVHAGTHQSIPICTDLCHSRVNEISRLDARGPECSIPYLRGPGVRSGENLNLLCASDEANVCVNDVRRCLMETARIRSPNRDRTERLLRPSTCTTKPGVRKRQFTTPIGPGRQARCARSI